MTSRLKTYIFFIAIVSFRSLFAQNHLPESNNLTGLWRQTVMVKTKQGGSLEIKTGNYKVINPDGTFYSFITWGANNPDSKNDITSMNMYGVYTITSDSTFTEHIIKHAGNPQMNNSDSELKYKFVPKSDNNLIYMMYKNSTTNSWIPELWQRVTFPKKETQLEQNVL